MHRDFKWLYEKHGDEARNILERICLEVLELEYPNDEVQDVRTTQGDGGIDVFISHENGDFTIVQCKFYLDDLNSSRKENIKKSYKRAIATKGDILTRWVLCTPKVFSNKEHDWWEEWKSESKKEFKNEKNKKLKVGLLSGNKFMRLIKKHGLYEEYFEVERVDKALVDKLINNDDKKKINEKLYVLIGLISHGDYFESELVSFIDQVMYLSEHRIFKGNDIFYYLDQLNQLIAFHSGPKGFEYEEKELELRKSIIEEYRKLDL